MTGDTPSAASIARTARRDARRRAIQACWRAGMSLREIAGLLNTTPESIGGAMYQMRRDGYDLPYRQRRPDLASPAERHRTQADGTPYPSRGAGLRPPTGAGAHPLTHNGGSTDG